MQITLNELGTGFSFCISAILANRLMLTVRSTYFNGECRTLTSMETRHVYSSATPGFQSYRTMRCLDVDRGRREVARTENGAVWTDDFDMTVFEEERGF